ncbi:MAG: response regulator [Candidatus Cloacimonetes bacterium]|nr:response regulator [Candidatus Cloacimonadota bacterium]
MKILTIDDSRMIRLIIVNTVRSLGYETLEAANADIALEIIEANYKDISLILLDWNMPGMNGFELLKILKSHEKYSSIPVMMVTTEGERKNVVKAIQSGADNYLTKPFTPEDLSTKIVECLGMSTQTEEEENLDIDLETLDF